MCIDAHFETLHGYQVVNWSKGDSLGDLNHSIYAIRIEYDDDETWIERFLDLMAQPGIQNLKGLVVGAYGDDMYENSAQEMVDEIIKQADLLQNLEILFFLDIISEENEISWILNVDNAPLIHAFPKLNYFGTRGSNDLRFNDLKSNQLQHLIIQSGGLSHGVLEDVLKADLPALEHLELYFGDENYGFDIALENLQPLWDGVFPKLTHLGLMNSLLADEMVEALATSALLPQLKVLDLSFGTLTDEGAQLLVENSAFHHLERIEIHFHYISDDWQSNLLNIKPKVVLSDPQEWDEDDGPYVAISE